MQEKSSFENARKNIQRGGKLLYRASRITAFALTVLVIVHAIALLSVFTSDRLTPGAMSHSNMCRQAILPVMRMKLSLMIFELGKTWGIPSRSRRVI